MSEQRKVQVAVCGAGAFGANHVRVYRQLEADGYPVHLAAIVDPAWKKDDGSEAIFGSVEEALSSSLKLEAASVCVPTSAHAEVASALLAAGLHVLVEKPIARSVEEADALIQLSRERQRVLQVGHLERFNPAIQAFLPFLNRPMFFEAHRLSVFTPRSLDVDVVLDLMVHDLDIVLQFAGSAVTEVRAVGLPILSARTDIANVRLEFASGCVANFTASRASTERVRKLRFFQPHQYVSIDYARQEILVIDVAAGEQPGGQPSLNFGKPMVKQGEPLKLEIESFLEAIRAGTEPVVSGEDGRAALALALTITDEIARHLRSAHLVGF